MFLLQIIRYVLNEGLITQGMLAAMAHPQLARIVTALHQQCSLSILGLSIVWPNVR